jgi:hypothetical protein
MGNILQALLPSALAISGRGKIAIVLQLPHRADRRRGNWALLSKGISVAKDQNACRPTKQHIPEVESRGLSVQ